MERKTVLITGCSSGFGRAICEAFDPKTYFVVATARKVEALQNVAANLRLELDVNDEMQIAQAVETVLEKTGRIDVLINNAGFSVRAAMEELDLEKYARMMEVNVVGCIRMMQAALPQMRKQRAGKILNIGSISGRMTSTVNGGYCSTKYAVEAITEAARYELADKGIQVCVIEPGAMETDFFKTLSANSDEQMSRKESPYAKLYQADLAYREKQVRASVQACAKQVVSIVEKKKLKVRYKVAVSWIFRLFVHFPDSWKDFLMRNRV